MSKDSDNKDEQENGHPPSAVEWAARTLSLLVIGVMAGYLTYKAVGTQHPPGFSFELDEDAVRQVEDTWVTPVTVTNTGSSGVSDLRFDVEQGERSIPITVALIGPGEAKQIAVWLPQRPSAEAVLFTVRSYQ